MPTAAQRRKAGKNAKGGVGVQQQLKLNGHSYVHRAMRLERQAAVHLAALQEVEADVLAARTREQLLVDMVLHQELVVAEILQQQRQQQQQHELRRDGTDTGSSSSSSSSSSSRGVGSQDSPAAAQDSSHRGKGSSAAPARSLDLFRLTDAVGRAAAAAQAGTRRAAAASSSSSSSSQAADGSYVMRLLRNPTLEQVQLVQAWGVEDWCNYWRSLFTRLAVLLELATREAEAAAASPSPAAAAAHGPHMQHLERVVDEVQTLTYLVHCHNHLPMFQSVLVNLETGEAGVPVTEAHRLCVAKRIELTPWQLQQLAAALAEFEGLSHDHSREGTALMSRANNPGWLFAEAAQQARMRIAKCLVAWYPRGPVATFVATLPAAARGGTRCAADAAAAALVAGGGRVLAGARASESRLRQLLLQP
ncbi:hypothetical protein OEZ85_011284 [Tetradesmus obliquus]|uniref:Uncharacterized protein n=1 Tax=Tetradesmus obliquus TaxID=3088 RepID=A0ABY8TPT9_TETOB|nr:hypothetical protein OEZ85_011284 [Tetradesmus obliquus]